MKKTKSRPNDLILDLRPVSKPIKKTPSKWIRDNKLVVIIGLVLFTALLAGVIGIVNRGHKTLGNKELASAKASVGRHMLLPTDEEPTLAQVDDKKAVKDPFIAQKSENGDQILIYAKNKLVVIYRPSIDKIVAAGDIFADPALTEADGATITVLDGADNTTKTQNVITKLTTLYPRMNITNGGKANKHDFPTTVIIDNNSGKDNLVDSIAQSIGGKRGIVPISESPASTNLMIIVGKN